MVFPTYYYYGAASFASACAACASASADAAPDPANGIGLLTGCGTASSDKRRIKTAIATHL